MRALLVAVVLVAATASPARAGVRDCDQTQAVRGRLAGVATVLNVRNMSCRRARRVIRRHGRSAGGGDSFDLGRFHCTRYFALEEDNKARCVRGPRAFRVDYGS